MPKKKRSRPLLSWWSSNLHGPAYPRKAGMVLGITQSVCAGTAIISQLIMVIQTVDGWPDPSQNALATLGTGMWCGLFFAISGGFGIAAAKAPNRCKVVTSMVMSIFSIILCLPLLAFAFIGTFMNTASLKDPTGSYGLFFRLLTGLQLLVVLVESISAIVSCALACRATCCADSPIEGKVVFSQNIEVDKEKGVITIPLQAVGDNSQGDSNENKGARSYMGAKHSKYERL